MGQDATQLAICNLQLATCNGCEGRRLAPAIIQAMPPQSARLVGVPPHPHPLKTTCEPFVTFSARSDGSPPVFPGVRLCPARSDIHILHFLLSSLLSSLLDRRPAQIRPDQGPGGWLWIAGALRVQDRHSGPRNGTLAVVLRKCKKLHFHFLPSFLRHPSFAAGLKGKAKAVTCNGNGGRHAHPSFRTCPEAPRGSGGRS